MQVFLFTTLPSNELGLLARSLPIAHDRAQRGHQVLLSSPAPAPGKVIAEAGFENLLPRYPLFHSGIARVLCAGRGPKRSDLLIHHGGYGSCQIGFCTGTPDVIIPTYSER